MRLSSIGKALAVLALACSASAQQLPFQLLLVQQGRAVSVLNGSTINFFTTVNQSESVRVVATYSGTGRAAVAAQPSLIGSPAFSAETVETPPFSLVPGGVFNTNIKFAPTSATQTNAQFRLIVTETFPPVVDGGAPQVINHLMLFSLAGTSPSFILSYTLQTDGNAVPLPPSGTISFPQTAINSNAFATLTINNRGSGSGLVGDISIAAGSAFTLTGRPLLPASVSPGQAITAQIIYRPTAVKTDTGQLRIAIEGDTPVFINLEGSGSAPRFVFESLQTTPPTPVVPGDTVVFPPTSTGQTNSIVLRILNSGNADGVINTISVIGQAYQLVGLPTLPRTVPPGVSIPFTVVFNPSQPGNLSGTLIIDSATFTLSGRGLGPQLSFSYVAGGTSIPLSGTSATVVFAPVQITQSAELAVTIRNNGTSPATLSNIGVLQTPSPFATVGLPAMPAAIDPDASLTFTVRFRPFALGFSNGTLQVDTSAIGLLGSGTEPPPMSSYTLPGPSGTVAAGSQTSVGLTLASPYPVSIAGSMTLSVSGTLPADPALQFASGGRTSPFVIPANSTEAVFAGQGTRIGLQTGTVAGAMTLTPSFATEQGNVNLNRDGQPVLRFNIAPATPVLSTLSASATGNSITIRISGFSTTRSLTAWNVTFKPQAGINMPTSQFTLDIKPVADAYFRNNASQAFGGQFSLAVQFSFQGVPVDQTTQSIISSVVTTLANEQGTSNSLESKVQ